MTPDQFFATYGPAARNVCHGTALLASVCLAQAALESGWGESGLTKHGFNFFGYKAGTQWKGAVLTLPTKEQIGGKLVTVQAAFRSYSSPGDSFTDRNRLFLTLPRYRPVLATTDYASQAHQIRACGYATDLKYAEKLVAIIEAHNLTRFDVCAMRTITHIVLHCTASPQTQTVDEILDYWKRPVAQGGNGWNTPGYHIMIPPNGASRRLVPDELPSNGVAGHNLHALHVSYIGGVDAHGHPIDNRTPAQIAEQIRIIRRWLAQYPNAVVLGHRDFPGVTKACPSFDARTWWASVK